MSKILPAFLLGIILTVIALPALLARSCSPPAEERPPAVDRTPIRSPAGTIEIRVFNHAAGQIEVLELEEYLVGVVAAEMPASFGLEALKAQAVVARTYTVNQMLNFGGKGCSKHPGADICTDSTHCQAWESSEQSLGKWPSAESENYFRKLRAAVRETAGEVVLHKGQTIDAVFHAHCGGHTENSENVWAAALPYLRGKPCPYCSDTRWSQTEHAFSGAEFAQKILPYVSAVPVSAAGRPLLDAAVRTPSGRLRQLAVAGETVSGRDFRSALKLPSTNVTWRITNDNVVFTAKGYGHGVGLCQYGADGMARSGKSHTEIISFYYSDVTVAAFSP